MEFSIPLVLQIINKLPNMREDGVQNIYYTDALQDIKHNGKQWYSRLMSSGQEFGLDWPQKHKDWRNKIYQVASKMGRFRIFKQIPTFDHDFWDTGTDLPYLSQMHFLCRSLRLVTQTLWIFLRAANLWNNEMSENNEINWHLHQLQHRW